MKEIRFVPNQAELTGKINPSTLEVKGNIFMAGESTGEGSPNTSNVEPAKRAQARAEFDQENAGRRLTPSELKRQNEDIMRGVGPTERRLRLDEEQTRRLIEEAVGSGEKIMAGASDTDPEQDVSWSRPGDLGTKSFSADEENDKTASDIEDAEDLLRRSREIEEPLREAILEALEEHGISLEEVRSRAPEVVEIVRNIIKNNEENQSQGENTGVRTGNATWRMKDEDRPIVVTGSLGKDKEGREYVSIEGSNTGIPLDQIDYPKEPTLEEIATDDTEERIELEGITEEAKKLLRRDPPGEIGKNIKRILRENGVSEEDINSKNSEELFDILRRKNAEAAGGQGGEPPKGRPTAEDTPEEPEKTPPPASAGAGGKGGEPPEEPPITPPSSDEEPEEHIETASDMVVDSEIRNIQARGRMRVKYATSNKERYEALAQTNLELMSIADRETPEGTPSLAWQKISTILENEKEKDIYAARSAKERSEDIDVQAREKIEQINKILTGDKTDDAKLDEIEDIIRQLDPNDRFYPHIIENAFKDIEEGEYDHLIEDILEYSLEMFLKRADEQPTEDYPQFTLTEGENMSVITQAARRFDDRRRKRFEKEKKEGGEEKVLGTTPGRKEMSKYLATLTNRRRIMHELFKSMNDLESYTGLVTRALRQSGTSFVETQLAGVSDVQIIYDQVLLTLKALKSREQGWLLEADFKRGDGIVREILIDSMTNEKINNFDRSFMKSDGNLGSRKLRSWEIERAFHMGRDLSAATQRRVVYGILGDVPKNPDEFLKSVAHEPIARRLAPFKLIPQRFFAHGIAKRFLEILREEQKRDPKTGEVRKDKYGYINKNGDAVGPFGSSQEDFAILDWGIVDPKSNSWRSRLLYLKNSLFKTETFDDQEVTLGEYLDKTKEEFTKGIDPHGSRNEKKEYRTAIKIWNKFLRLGEGGKIEGSPIDRQRLFLGVLLRYPDLDPENKKIIWKNVAKLMPSRIASIMPDETLEIVGKHMGQGSREEAGDKWIVIARKLWIAERMRVANDSSVLRGKAGAEGELYDLDHYYEKVGLKPEEIRIIEEIKALGEEYAPDLAKIKFPFTAFLDDAPETGWEELSDFDFARILVNDQSAFQEGYGHIIGLIDNPVRKSADVVNIFHEAFEKVKQPPGVGDAQKLFEPIVKATLRMRSMNIEAKFLGTFLSRLFRMPTSEIEKYNLSAQVADDEFETSEILRGLAQIEVLNDDPNDADIDTGMTQLMRVKKDAGADKKALALAYARVILQIFGPIFGSELLKALGIKLE